MNVFYYRHNRADETPHVIEHSNISFNELTFVLKGELKYCVNGEIIKVKEKDCIFIKKDSTRERRQSPFCDYISFNFKKPLNVDLPPLFENCISGEIKLLFSVCDEIVAKYYEWTDKIETALKLIVNILTDKLSTNEENPTIVNIKRYVNKNLSQKLTLEKISATVGYSPNYCDTLFKKETGTSLLNYVIEERISKAKLLLQEGILSLKEIAESVGFEDYNYFSRTFKKKSGYSPKEYNLSLYKK